MKFINKKISIILFVLFFSLIILVSADYFWTSDLNTNLQVYYKFNQAGTITIENDSSGHSQDNLTCISCVSQWTSLGKINSATSLNGGDYWQTNASLFANTTTINFWAYIDNKDNSWDFVSKYSDNLGYYRYRIYVDTATDKIRARTDRIGDNGVIISSVTAQVGQWYMITYIINDSGQELLINNVSQGIHATSLPLRFANENNLVIGGNKDPTNSYTFSMGYIGRIDEFSIHSRQLSYSEISQIYNNTNGMTHTTNQPSNILLILALPINNTYSNISNQNFTCNMSSSSYDISNLTFYIFNSSKDIYNQTNVSLLGSQNHTSFFINLTYDGIFQWNCKGYDNNSLFNWSLNNFTFIIDTINPNINFSDSGNMLGNYSRNYIFVNATYNDTNVNQSIINLFNFSRMLINSSNATSFNYTNLQDGVYYINLTATDYTGNYNNSLTIKIILDTAAPNISLIIPYDSQTFSFLNNSINFTITDDLTSVSSCWFKIDNASNIIYNNISLPGCLNNTFNVSSDGKYNITLYTNDSLNNMNYTKVQFLVSTTIPGINLDYPKPNYKYVNTKNITFNFTATDSDGLSSCELYGNWSGSFIKNFTWIRPTNATENYTYLNFSEDASYLYNIKCNDTLNNYNWAANNFTFTIDTINPTISTHTLAQVGTTQRINFNFTVNDTNLDYCRYTVYDASSNVVTNDTFICNSMTNIGLPSNSATYNLTAYTFDKAGNYAYIINTITISPTASIIVSPTGGGGSTPPAAESEWTITTEQNTGSYKFRMSPGSSRTRQIVLENQDTKVINIKLTCEGNGSSSELCNYIIFDKSEITLPIGIEVPTNILFTVNLPEDANKDYYVANIIGTDDTGNRKILTIEIDTSGGIILDLLDKISTSKVFDNGFKLPYFLIFVLSFIIIFLMCFYGFFKSDLFNKIRLFISILIALGLGFLSLYFF